MVGDRLSDISAKTLSHSEFKEGENNLRYPSLDTASQALETMCDNNEEVLPMTTNSYDAFGGFSGSALHVQCLTFEAFDVDKSYNAFDAFATFDAGHSYEAFGGFLGSALHVQRLTLDAFDTFAASDVGKSYDAFDAFATFNAGHSYEAFGTFSGSALHVQRLTFDAFDTFTAFDAVHS